MMAIRIQLSSGQNVEFDSPSATVGTDPSCDIVVPEQEGLHARHATIKRIVNRWMIESEGDWPLQVGQEVPGRKAWLEPGDVIRLTESGPSIVFQPAVESFAASRARVPTAVPSMGKDVGGHCSDRDLRSCPAHTERPLVAAPESHEWYYAKGQQSWGPVSTSQLQRLFGRGEIRPTDVVWCEGMPDWQPANSVKELRGTSPAFPTSLPRAPSEPLGIHTVVRTASTFWDRTVLHVTRAFSLDLRSLVIRRDEYEHLSNQGITGDVVQRYLCWRCSILIVVIVPTLLTALVGTLNLASRFDSASGFGALANCAHLLSLYAMPVAAFVASRAWSRLQASRLWMLYGWLISFLVPILVALLPLEWLLELEDADTTAALQGQKIGLGVAGLIVGVYSFFQFLPTVLSLIPGAMRACVRLKMLLPQSLVPGWFLIAASLVYALILLPVFIAVSKFCGNFLLIVGVMLLVFAPLLYVIHGRVFVQPLSSAEASHDIRRVQRWVVAAMILAVFVLAAFVMTKRLPLADKYLIGFSEKSSLLRPWNWTVIQFAVEYVGRSLFVMALALDLFIVMNTSVWRNSERFNGTTEAEIYKRLIKDLAQVSQGLWGGRPDVPGNPVHGGSPMFIDPEQAQSSRYR